MPPTVDCIAPSTLRAASLTAARTKSCSISTSPDYTASGSICRLSSCLRPSILAVTVPPPDEASTTVSCIFFCRVSYCALAFDINSCKLSPPIKPPKPDFGPQPSDLKRNLYLTDTIRQKGRRLRSEVGSSPSFLV